VRTPWGEYYLFEAWVEVQPYTHKHDQLTIHDAYATLHINIYRVSEDQVPDYATWGGIFVDNRDLMMDLKEAITDKYYYVDPENPAVPLAIEAALEGAAHILNLIAVEDKEDTN